MWRKCVKTLRTERASHLSLSSSLSSYALHSLRALMRQENISALLVPSSDPHLSEYIAPCFSRVMYLSHFTGSAGTIVLMRESDREGERALLWTDGRYHLQALKELSSDWTLMRDGRKDVPTVLEYLRENLSPNDRIGYDSTLHSAQYIQSATQFLSEKQIFLIPFTQMTGGKNPIDIVWESDTPARPSLPVSSSSLRIHPISYAGLSPSEKLQLVRSKYLQDGDLLILSSLDEIAWLLNLRGNDVQWNPTFLSYVLIEKDSCLLYLNQYDSEMTPLSSELQTHLSLHDIQIRPYSNFYSDIQNHLSEHSTKMPRRVLCDPSTTNQAIWSLIPGNILSPLSSSPIDLLKACKNTVELNGMKACHLRDAAACVHFLSEMFSLSHLPRDEVEIDEKLTFLRSFYSPSLFLFPSFATIAGSGPNGAIVHYRAQRENCRQISKEEMLLIDSGGQYEDGTTDITRTIHLGEATDRQREMYTRVLMGHIDLASLSFPSGTAGCLLDSIARRPLWDINCNYLHGMPAQSYLTLTHLGTGHGVGAALCVHEGPQRISSHLNGTKFSQPLLENMIVSIEPGYYETGTEELYSQGYGIRLENLYVVKRDERCVRDSDSSWYLFEPLTYVPFQRNLIDLSLLSRKHINWLNEYHQQVVEKVACNYSEDSEIRKWLNEACAPIEMN